MLAKQTLNRTSVVGWTAGRPQSIGALILGLLLALAVALNAQPANARSAPESFADLAEKLLPAVVNISSSQVVRTTRQEIPQAPPGSPLLPRPRLAAQRSSSSTSWSVLASTAGRLLSVNSLCPARIASTWAFKVYEDDRAASPRAEALSRAVLYALNRPCRGADADSSSFLSVELAVAGPSGEGSLSPFPPGSATSR